MNTAVSGTLAIGSAVAALVLATGFGAWIVTGAGPSTAPDAAGWLARVGRLEPAAIMFAGLALVTLTPVAQLAAALIAFSRQGDRRHAAVAAAVLAVVLGSAVLALVMGGMR